MTASTSFAGIAPEVTSYNPVPKVAKPMLRIQDSMVTVSILFAQTPVTVTVMETDGTEIYTGKFENKESFFKKFDISAFPRGEYLFAFTYNNTTFTETVKK